MFVRKLTLNLKPNMSTQLTSAVEKQINPLLRKQQGFKDQMAFVKPGSSEVEVISIWDSQTDAETFARSAYNDVLKIYANLIEGSPKVETAEMLYSTFHEIPTGKKIAA
jgi:heme-degrading monooxygenase HmoA